MLQRKTTLSKLVERFLLAVLCALIPTQSVAQSESRETYMTKTQSTGQVSMAHPHAPASFYREHTFFVLLGIGIGAVIDKAFLREGLSHDGLIGVERENSNAPVIAAQNRVFLDEEAAHELSRETDWKFILHNLGSGRLKGFAGLNWVGELRYSRVDLERSVHVVSQAGNRRAAL